MALEYQSTMKFEKLAPVLEEYADWFASIAVCVAYNEEEQNISRIMTPASFHVWLEDSLKEQDITPIIAEEINKVHEDVSRAGAALISDLKAGDKPPHSDFVEFKNLYTSFLMRIRRLEKDSALDGSGLDEETGLRSAKTIEDDLKKEMDRLSRQGHPFSLVATNIDFFAAAPDQTVALSVAVENVKRCVRSFDDAYYLGNGHFLLSLKHADIIGAQACVNRLQQFLKEDEKNSAKMTMSYCMAEPVPGDEAKTLISHMLQDLNEHMNEADAVLKLLEMSELERFVSKME